MCHADTTIDQPRCVAVIPILGATERSATAAGATNPRWLRSKSKTITPKLTMRGYATLDGEKCKMFIDYEGRAFGAGMATGGLLGICFSLLVWALII